jgi:hypothetical protein
MRGNRDSTFRHTAIFSLLHFLVRTTTTRVDGMPVLKKLKRRQLYFKERLKNELDPDERDRIARTLEVIKVQRKKGIRLCKELKDQKR